MDDRKQTFLSFVALTGVLLTAACGYNQQARFQMSFLPRAPHSGIGESETIPQPTVSSNPYLQQKLPLFAPANRENSHRFRASD